MALGKVTHVFKKTRKSIPLECPIEGKLELVRGYGIAGDANANSISPRQVLVVSLEQLNDIGAKPASLRENIVISGMPIDTLKPGREIRFSSGAAIRLTFFCEPCKRIAGAVSDFKNILHRRGILGVVTASGIVSLSTECHMAHEVREPLPEVPFLRFVEFVRLVPEGKVVTYKTIALGMGVADSFARAVPGYIVRASEYKIPLHRIVDTAGGIIRYVPNQQTRLLQEGVEIQSDLTLFDRERSGRVDLQKYEWRGGSLWL